MKVASEWSIRFAPTANARLIAAAPDYYAASEEVLRAATRAMKAGLPLPTDLRGALLRLADAHCRVNHDDEPSRTE